MLSHLREHMKKIMLAVVIIFAFSMFYGLGYTGLKSMSSGGSNKGFLKINGKDVDPVRFDNIFSKIRENYPQRIKPSDLLFIQNMALSQTIDYMIILDEAKKKERVAGGELDAVIENIAKQQKFNSVRELQSAVEVTHLPWDQFKKMVRDDILVQKINNSVRGGVVVGPNDLREVRAGHILIRIKDENGGDDTARKLAEQLLQRALKGEKFEALAKKYSEDPSSKARGGDLGFFTIGAMVKPFEDLVFSLKPNEIGGSVKTDFGYHIIKLYETRIRTIKGVQDIQGAIFKEKQDKAFQEWFYELKQKAKVEILDPNLRALDLRYKGKMADAIAEYQKAIVANPSNGYLKLFLGVLYEDMGRLKDAIASYKEGLSQASADPMFYTVLAKAYLKSGDKSSAIEYFKKSSLIAGDDKMMHEELLKSFKELGFGSLVDLEKSELNRIGKKEAFEKSLKDGTKINRIRED